MLHPPTFQLRAGVAIVVAAQALPELEPDVAQLRGAGGVAADAEYKSPQRAALCEAVPTQPAGQAPC